jgi:hypothetical protein
MAKGGKGGGGSSSGVIKGNKRDNDLTGTSGDDIIQAQGGNDTITGLEGNDTIDGGSGSDTAIFSGLRTEYTVVQIDANTIEITGPDGTDTITNVEFFQFGDQTETFAEVVINPQANLAAGTLLIDDNMLDPGESLVANWSIASNGELDATATQATLVIATSPDMNAVVDTGETVNTSALNSGDAVTLSASFAGDTLAPGTYYLAVVVDDGNALDESNETDNVTNWVAFTVAEPEQNLSATGLSLSDVELDPGESLTASWTISADGNLDIGATSSSLVIATAPDMGSVIGSGGSTAVGSLSPGQSTTVNLNIDWDSLAPGTYYIAAVADDGDLISETDETDNQTVWLSFTVAEPIYNLGLTGLSLDALQSDLDLKNGASLNVSYDVSNTGNFGDANFTVTTVLSTDGAISPDDLVIGTSTGSMALGQSATYSQSLTVDGSVLAGDYQVISSITWDDGVSEADLSDNTAALPTAVTLVGGLVTGTSGADTFVGTAASEIFDLGDGDDIVFGSTGDDDILGGAGFAPVDFSNFGEAVDIQSHGYTQATNYFLIHTVLGYDSGQPAWSGTATDVERFVGTDFDDRFFLDTEDGLTIEAGGGNDLVLATYNADTIDGGSGDDILVGYWGNDTIATGEGADIVWVERDVTTSPSEGHGNDVVTDFDPLLDALIVSYAPYYESYDPFADLTQTSEGALLSYADDSSILLIGVDITELNATNLILEENDPALSL